MSLLPNDIAIAGILVAVALVVVLISRTGLLPSKSLPYIAGALLGVVFVALGKRMKKKAILAEADKRRDDLNSFAASIVTTDRNSANVAVAVATTTDAAVTEHEAAAAAVIGRLDANTANEIRDIDSLHGDELQQRFAELNARLLKERGKP
jgi:uncharacterized membrane protein